MKEGRVANINARRVSPAYAFNDLWLLKSIENLLCDVYQRFSMIYVLLKHHFFFDFIKFKVVVTIEQFFPITIVSR